MTSNTIAVRAAYIRVGYKSKYESGGVLTAAALTTVDEGQSDISDEELAALGTARVDSKIAEVLAETPHYNIFQREVRVGSIAMRSVISKRDLIALRKQLKKEADAAERAFNSERTPENGKLMVETAKVLADKFGMWGDLRELSDSYGITE
jgi:hypothetical protein